MSVLSPPTDPLVPLPPQPASVPWPTEEWPTGEPGAGVDAPALTATLDRMFGPDPDPVFGDSFAGIVVHGGRIVAERYGSEGGVDATHTSWSMAKSITQALVGMLVTDGMLDPEARAPVAAWADPEDPRHEITLGQLLRMVDGLDFNETYVDPSVDPDELEGMPVSHAIDMLFGEGADDHAAYAAARPLAHPPGTFFNYSSGTSNIVAGIVCDLIGRGDDATAWMRERLFDPIGMRSALPGFDGRGTFVGSSTVFATARDFARFGLLYVRGGEWDGRRLVPASWVEAARTPRARDAETGFLYGSHWWMTDDPRGMFWASGFQGQRIFVVPANDVVIVRLGRSPDDDVPQALTGWGRDIAAAFDGAG